MYGIEIDCAEIRPIQQSLPRQKTNAGWIPWGISRTWARNGVNTHHIDRARPWHVRKLKNQFVKKT